MERIFHGLRNSRKKKTTCKKKKPAFAGRVSKVNDGKEVLLLLLFLFCVHLGFAIIAHLAVFAGAFLFCAVLFLAFLLGSVGCAGVDEAGEREQGDGDEEFRFH
jgi:hypothetical protein